MVSVIVRVALLLYFLHLVAHVTGQSSCIPDYFRYIQHENSDEFRGRIEIRQAPKGVALDISATFSISVKLSTSYVGRMELAQSSEESFEGVQQGRPLKYNIYFPLRRPIPELTSLSINNRTVCTGRQATGQIVTYIVLNNQLMPPQTKLVPLPPVSTPPPVRQTVRPVTPATTAETKPNTGTDQTVQQCGRSIIAKTNVGHVIIGGEKSAKGQWPWLVAIYKLQKARDSEFQCAGTLVTHTHVITAAHCFQGDKQTLLSGGFSVYVGRYKLHDWKESWSVRREVIKYTIHPDYQLRRDNESAGSADSDLAVLTLNKRVEYTEMIQPICLWSSPMNLEDVVGQIGVVVGWGPDKVPLQTASEIVSQDDCLRSHEEFRLTTSKRTFCAGTRTGSGPYKNASGSGFVIYNPNTDRYYLRGVVSTSIGHQNTQFWDLRSYVVYVDVAKYLDWIGKQIFM